MRGEGGIEKWTRVMISCVIMYVTRGEGVKKFEIFMDVIDGRPLAKKLKILLHGWNYITSKFASNNHANFLKVQTTYEPTHVLMAIRMMLVGVDTFSLTLNRRLSTEKELRKNRWQN